MLVLDIYAIRGAFEFARLGRKPTEIMKEESNGTF